MKWSTSVCLSIGIAALIGQSAARAQDYPSKQVRIIVPAQAGVGGDIIVRDIAALLSKSMGQQFFVDNRPGAGGNIGMALAAKAPHDGYTLVQGALGQSVLNQFLFPPAGFDPDKDFEPVGLMVKLPFAIVVNPKLPASSMQELVAMSKDKPNTINVALSTLTAIIVEAMLRKSSGAQLFPVRYTGPAQAVPNVLSGQVPVYMDTIALLKPFVTSGKMKALAVTSLASSDLLPGVKSVAEQGFPDFGEAAGWIGLFAPKDTPQAIIHTLNTELNKALAAPETHARAFELGGLVSYGTPQEFGAYVASERDKWGKLVQSEHIKADQ